MGYSQNPQNIPKTKLQLTPPKPQNPYCKGNREQEDAAKLQGQGQGQRNREDAAMIRNHSSDYPIL